MIGFTYHSSGDPYHCAFRALRILAAGSRRSYRVEVFRILDFYLLFPFLIRSIQMPRAVRKAFGEHGLKAISEPFQKLPDARQLFRQIEDVQRTAYRHLAAIGILDVDAYGQSQIVVGEQIISSELRREVGRLDEVESAIVDFLVEHLANIELYGPRGIKARTGLMEFRYDPS